jgi:cytochrome P450
MIFDYENVEWALTDQETFSSRVPAPRNWFIFSDPPVHTKLRALISRAFTPRMIANLEFRIRDLCKQLLGDLHRPKEMDFAAEFSVPLPMKVIAGMIGILDEHWPLSTDVGAMAFWR